MSGQQLSVPLDPTTKQILLQETAIPFTKTLPTFIPRYNGYTIIYFDGTSYYLYIYVNGGWRKATLT